MSTQELIALIDAELIGNTTSEKDRDKATGRKGYNVMSKNLGTAISDYLYGTYWQRVTEYIDSRINERMAGLESAIAGARSAAEAAQNTAQQAQNTAQGASDAADRAAQAAQDAADAAARAEAATTPPPTT